MEVRVKKASYSSYKNRATKRIKKNFEINKETFESLLKQRCYICGLSGTENICGLKNTRK
jgi:hypothetical protein